MKLLIISDEESRFINVSDDWVYYTNGDNNTFSNGDARLYKIRTDGTQRTAIGEEKGDLLNVVGDMIYFRDYGDSTNLYCIYKIRTDGTEKVKLTQGGVRDFYLIGDWIFFEDFDDGFCKIRTDGTERQSALSRQ